MATAAKIVTETKDIVAWVDDDPSIVLTGTIEPDSYVAKLREGINGAAHDIGTATGRDKIKSEAHSIRTKKAAIDRKRKELTEGWRKQTAAVNAAGTAIISKLDALIEEVRAPVTEWERAEEKRITEGDAIIADLRAAAIVTAGTSADDAQAQLDRIRGINLNSDVLGVRLDMATEIRNTTVAALTETVANLRAQEAQAAELEQLRRERAEAEARAEREAADRAAKERAEAAAKAEADRIAKAAQEAADKARREAEQAAEQARRDAEEAAERRRQEEAAAARAAEEERQRKAQAEINAANARAAEAEAAAQAERDRIAAEQRAREEAAAAEAEAQRRRDADLAHRQQVIDVAAEKLTELGLSKKLATTIIHAIEAGNVPAVSIKF